MIEQSQFCQFHIQIIFDIWFVDHETITKVFLDIEKVVFDQSSFSDSKGMPCVRSNYTIYSIFVTDEMTRCDETQWNYSPTSESKVNINTENISTVLSVAYLLDSGNS